MEKEFVPYELAVKLKEIGFDEKCFGAYHNENYLDLSSEEYDYSYAVKAPLFQQAFRWFREKNYYIAINIYSATLISSEFFTIEIEYINEKGMIEWIDDFISNTQFDTYEEAELACLTKLIEILETRTK